MTSKLARIALVSALFLAIPALAVAPAVSTAAPMPVVTASVGSVGMALAELGHPGFERTPAGLERAPSGAGANDDSSAAARVRGWHIALNAACWLLGLVALGLSRVSQRRQALAWHGSASVSHRGVGASALSGAGRLEI